MGYIFIPALDKMSSGKSHHIPGPAGMMSFSFLIIRHVYNYRKLKTAAQQLRIKKQQAELNYLNRRQTRIFYSIL